MHRLAEYEALRATIRERGTVRMCVILAGLVAWGALLLALNALEYERAVTLVPLLVLATTFEISFFMHTGVERVGRYLQVFYEDMAPLSEPAESKGPALSESKGWENTIMAYGRNYPGGLDPLFITLFAIITVVDFFGAFPAAARHVAWIAFSLVGHLTLGWRLVSARRLSAGQRAADLERFRVLKNPPASN